MLSEGRAQCAIKISGSQEQPRPSAALDSDREESDAFGVGQSMKDDSLSV